MPADTAHDNEGDALDEDAALAAEFSEMARALVRAEPGLRFSDAVKRVLVEPKNQGKRNDYMRIKIAGPTRQTPIPKGPTMRFLADQMHGVVMRELERANVMTADERRATFGTTDPDYTWMVRRLTLRSAKFRKLAHGYAVVSGEMMAVPFSERNNGSED